MLIEIKFNVCSGKVELYVDGIQHSMNSNTSRKITNTDNFGGWDVFGNFAIVRKITFRSHSGAYKEFDIAPFPTLPYKSSIERWIESVKAVREWANDNVCNTKSFKYTI